MKLGGKKLEFSNKEIKQVKRKWYGEIKVITRDGREETFSVRSRDLEKLQEQWVTQMS
jgi:hypothetical protein